MQKEALQALLQDMSLEEKIGELYQLSAAFFDVDTVTGPAEALGLTPEAVQAAGSCLSVTGAEKIRRIQEQHMASQPHHIPMLFMADIINGYKTVFPIPLAQGATFDPPLVESAAAIAAREAAAAGLHVTFSPMADLVQDARWGRVMESTGEDAYLNGCMAAAMVRGYQGEKGRLVEKGRMAACLKHFAGYGAPLGGRDYNTVELSPRTLREDYLPAYQSAIDAGCAMVMTSFNTLNRVPSTANRWLMRDVLRGEMGFAGVLISDWAAVGELIPHGIAQDEAQAAELAMKAGVDVDMATGVYARNIKGLLQSGRLDEALIDEAVLRILILKNDLGLFENPFKDASEEDEDTLLLCQEHRRAAQDCAIKSFVLLKNETDFLPLKQQETIAVIGPYANHCQINGGWSIFAEDSDCTTLRQGIEQCFPDCHVTFAPGSTMVDPGVKVIPFKYAAIDQELDAQKALEEAVNLAKKADKVVLALGEPRDYTGECTSRANLTLPECQMKLLRQVCAANPETGVVLFGGRPLDLREIERNAKAILMAWLPGTEGGNALAKVLFGKAAPSGKLPMSFPYCVGQVPVSYNRLNTGRPLRGDYRAQRFSSQYIDIPNEPLFPFGYGLTYTSFSCSQVMLDGTEMTAQHPLHASVQVMNTGKTAGTETVQMYIRDVAGSVARPLRSLKGFRKVTLAPGESERVVFEITEDMLRFYDINMDFVSEPGQFEVYIGFDSTASNGAAFTLLP